MQFAYLTENGVSSKKIKRMFYKKKLNVTDGLIVEKQEQIFYINNINRGDIVFDVGANVGELTLLFSRFADTSGQVHSFEPTPSTFEKLTTLIKTANKTNVTLNNLAISDKPGFVNFNIYEEQLSAFNTMAERPLEDYGIHVARPKTYSIPSMSIDEYCAEQTIFKIDLLKMDVEGAELNVLYGAEKMFAEKKIRICVFEFGQTVFDMGNTVKQYKDFFNKYDYQVSNVVKEQNVFPIDPKTGWACFSILVAKPN